MKTTTMAAEAAAFESARPATGWANSIAVLAKGTVASVQKTLAKRRRFIELVNLDERMLKDIGVSEEEIGKLKARRQLLPYGWTG
jgi:uncharacterized protein YjiS (DUF1127 family)